MKSQLSVLFLATAMFCLSFGCATEATKYQLTDLGTLGGSTSHANAINDQGYIVGWAGTTNNNRHAFLWVQGRGMTDLGTLGGRTSEALAISNKRDVVGWSAIPNGGGTHAAMFELAESFTSNSVRDLHPTGPSVPMMTQATAVNESGAVIGWSSALDGESNAYQQRPLLLDAANPVDFGDFGGGATAHAINNIGRVVGESVTAGGVHASIWSKGKKADLSTLGGQIGTSTARAINNHNQVAGASQRENSSTIVACLWSLEKPVSMKDLGTLGGDKAIAYGLNDSAVVVGTSNLANGKSHAFICTEETGMVDLNTRLDSAARGWVLVEARGVNANGEIVGWGLKNGQERAFLLKPMK